MSDKPVVTRFAPSPTGALHVGGARTALFNWAYARGRGGRFILRIEDTDLARSTPAATRGILRDLAWLGIDWDEGPDLAANDPYAEEGQLGNSGPYFQSQRHEQGVYEPYFQKLIDAGLAYEDDGALRFRMPSDDIIVNDAVLGEVRTQAGQVEDFIIRKGEAGGRLPTYHFAVVIDDAQMGVTHVIRGQEHLNNAAKHVALMDALGIDRPVFAHIPLIFNPDGSKMSKRDKAKMARKAAKGYVDEKGIDGLMKTYVEATLFMEFIDEERPTKEQIEAFLDKQNDELGVAVALAATLELTLPEIDVDDFRLSGYLPDVLNNYLALLGWNPGGNQERFDRGFLSERFDFDRVQKGNAKFDRDKLRAFNFDTIRELRTDQFAHELQAFFADRSPLMLKKLGDNLDAFAACYQERSHTLAEPAELGAFFVQPDDTIAYDASQKNVKKAMLKNDGEGVALLKAFAPLLAELPEENFGAAAHEAMQAFCAEREAKIGNLAQPIRVAVSGGTVTPPIDATLDILGKQTTLRRVANCLKALESVQQ